MESWKHLQDRVVDGTFPLQRYLGGDAVYLTEYEGRPAAIKILAANETQLKQWRAAVKLSHPNLLRLFRAGRCRLDGKEVIYAVMEYAEEDLSQVLPERALTAQEARDVLNPALSALGYLHGQGTPGKGLVHGHLKPSNIMAIGDQVKLSTDRVARGDAADDVKGLGATLVEALTQRRPMWPHLPETLPQPFRDIAEHTLHPDAKKRWTLAQIAARLQGAPAVKRKPVRWQYLLPVGAAVLAILVFAWRSGGSRTETLPVPSPEPKSEPAAAPVVATKPEPVRTPAPAARVTSPSVALAPAVAPARDTSAAEAPAGRVTTTAGVEQEVLPEIPRKAVSTIHGTLIVSVKVQVNPSGDVSEAKIDPPSGSRYISKYVLDAAKRWKFGTSEASQAWTLRFVITRNDMKVLPKRLI